MRSAKAWCVAVGFTLGLAGCTQVSEQTVQHPALTKDPAVKPVVVEPVKKVADGPKRQPLAITCLEGGKCVEETGSQQQDAGARMGYYQKARMAYEQAREIDPKMHIATIRLARLHEKMGNGGEAAKCLEDALVKHPQEAIFWCELGLCRARQKDWERAIKHLQRAAQLEPSNPVYANHVGWALARAGMLDESLDHFRKTVGDARAYYNLAKMTKHLGRPDLSRDYAAAALSIDPQFAEARDLLAQLDNPPPANQEVRQATHVEIEQ